MSGSRSIQEFIREQVDPDKRVTPAGRTSIAMSEETRLQLAYLSSRAQRPPTVLAAELLRLAVDDAMEAVRPSVPTLEQTVMHLEEETGADLIGSGDRQMAYEIVQRSKEALDAWRFEFAQFQQEWIKGGRQFKRGDE